MDKKKFIPILSVPLVLGLLFYSIIFFTLNKLLDPAELSFADSDAVYTRLFWRHTAEMTLSICSSLYVIGLIFIIFFFVKRNIFISKRAIFAYFGVQIGIALVCAVPFAILDRSYWGDYLFPIWGILGRLLLLLLTAIIAQTYQQKKGKALG